MDKPINTLNYRNYRAKVHDPTLRRLYESIDCARLLNTRYILDNALLNLSGIYGRTALSIACHIHDDKWKMRSTIIGWLLEQKCNFNFQDENGLTLLNWVCKEHKTDIFKLLFKKYKMDMRYDITDEHGDSPLMHAVRTGDIELIKVLLQALVQFGISVDIRNKQGMTPYAEAQKLRFYKIAEHLVDVGEASTLVSITPVEWPTTEHKFNDTLKESRETMSKPNIIRIEAVKYLELNNKLTVPRRAIIKKDRSYSMATIKTQNEDNLEESTKMNQLMVITSSTKDPSNTSTDSTDRLLKRRQSSPAVINNLLIKEELQSSQNKKKDNSDRKNAKNRPRSLFARRSTTVGLEKISENNGDPKNDSQLSDVSSICDDVFVADLNERFEGHPADDINNTYKVSTFSRKTVGTKSPSPARSRRSSMASHLKNEECRRQQLMENKLFYENKLMSLMNYQMSVPSSNTAITYVDLKKTYGPHVGTTSYADINWLLMMKEEQKKDSFLKSVSYQKNVLKPSETYIPNLMALNTAISERSGSGTPKRRMSLANKQSFFNAAVNRFLSG